MNRNGYIYILSSGRNGTLYVGVTSNLRRRLWQHKEKMVEGFTSKIHQKLNKLAVAKESRQLKFTWSYSRGGWQANFY